MAFERAPILDVVWFGDIVWFSDIVWFGLLLTTT